jgi:hypothetical protein
MLIYGFPLSLLGFALSYAQLEPVPCRSTQAALDLRESQATDIQKQVRGIFTPRRYEGSLLAPRPLGTVSMQRSVVLLFNAEI